MTQKEKKQMLSFPDGHQIVNITYILVLNVILPTSTTNALVVIH